MAGAIRPPHRLEAPAQGLAPRMPSTSQPVQTHPTLKAAHHRSRARQVISTRHRSANLSAKNTMRHSLKRAVALCVISVGQETDSEFNLGIEDPFDERDYDGELGPIEEHRVWVWVWVRVWVRVWVSE